jgi:hypothetical protein
VGNDKVSQELLDGLIDRIVRACRLLALVAIQDAGNEGVAPKKISAAQKELAKGDSEALNGNCGDEIAHYREAWLRAVRATIAQAVHVNGGAVHLEVLGSARRAYVIEVSTNLRDWTILATQTADGGGLILVEDTEAGKCGARFYRVLEP